MAALSAARRPVRAVGVLAPGRPALLDLTEPAPGPGEAWGETAYTGVSAGTEVTVVRGQDPHHRTTWDRELRMFRDGPPSSGYPVEGLGYMEVARVAESRTSSLPEGSWVAAAYGHRTARCLAPGRDAATVLPRDLDPLLGIYVAQMGPIAVNGLLHAAADAAGPAADLADGVRGRHVLVVGAGVVGLLCALLATELGADAVSVVVGGERRGVAERLGLGTVADDAEEPAELAVKRSWRHGPGDHGADVVLQCRGRSEALATALKAVRPQGTVVDLAFHIGGADAVRLGEEFHHNGLTLRCAQIGRVPRGMAPTWDRPRLQAATLDLLRSRGADVRRHLVTDRLPFEDGPELLADLAAGRRHTVQAVLDVGPQRAGDAM